MDWVKQRTDDFLKSDLAAADDATEVMYGRGKQYCGLAETSGFIPVAVVATLGRKGQSRSAAALVAMGRWEAVPGGFVVVGWAEEQAELEALLSRRKRDAARKRRGRKAGLSADASAETGADSAPPLEEEEETTTDVVVVRDDVERLCRHLADRIEANGSKRPNPGQRWRDAARLLLDADGHTEAQVHRAIDWCQDHEFWRANILSMPTLRARYDQLRLQAEATRSGSRDAVADTAAAMERARAAEAREAAAS